MNKNNKKLAKIVVYISITALVFTMLAPLLGSFAGGY
jgi:hypothetical protein